MTQQTTYWKGAFLFASAFMLLCIWTVYPQLSGAFSSIGRVSAPHIDALTSWFKNCTEADKITNRLLESEANWIRTNQKRGKEGNGGLAVNANGRILWDFFYPSFDCPFTTERIGRVGDGGKWVCGFDRLATKDRCVVFSFGIGGETSFEEEILRRTPNCIVHMFDHTLPSAPSLIGQYPGRAFFQQLGISSEDGESVATLKTIMAKLEVKGFDILKMDVEGAEWGSMRRILDDFPQGLPFAQLQIELHLSGSTQLQFKALDDWWKQLEGAGLRPFFREPNLVNSRQPMLLRELAFLNIKMEPFKLPATD